MNVAGAGGGIGGVGGGMGGGAGVSAGGGVSAGASVAGTSGGPSSPKPPTPGGGGSPEPSAKVTISKAAELAVSQEPRQVGASFSVSKDDAGHHYVGNSDANGFSNPDLKPTQQVNSTEDASNLNALGQDTNELNKLSDALAMLLLMLMSKKN